MEAICPQVFTSSDVKEFSKDESNHFQGIGLPVFLHLSHEETRRHVHIVCGDGEAKFWLEPEIELAINFHLVWQEHFGA